MKKSLQYEQGQLENRPKPLRLILLGDPGAGKSHTTRVTVNDLKNICADIPDEWDKHIKLNTPSGCAAFVLSDGARTGHDLFKIQVGDIFKPLEGDSNEPDTT